LHPTDPDKDDDSNYDQEGSIVECNYTQHTPSNSILVIRCAFTQYEEKDD